MSIIISKNGKDAEKVEKSDFVNEDYMQKYIHNNPEAIPVYEIQKDKKLFVVKRELQTNSGPIDALAVDQDGDIYIIETKLFRNSDKRTVVAQALDYGSALWKHYNDFELLMSEFNEETQRKFNLDFTEKLNEFFEIDDDKIENLIRTLRSNLNDGNFKFVIMMDEMEERLKNLIIYVNQNSQFDIYAVQLEYYKFNENEIIIPKIFGVEVKKNIKNSSNGTRKKWTKEDFLKDVKSKCDLSLSNLIEDMFNFLNSKGDRLAYGTGNNGLVSVKLSSKNGYVTPIRLEAGGLLIFGLNFILFQKDKISENIIYDLVDSLEKIEGADVRDGVQFKRSEVYLNLEKLLGEDEEINKLKNEISQFFDLVHDESK